MFKENNSNINNNQKEASLKTHKRKAWLILGITLAVILILVLFLYSPARTAIFGKAIIPGNVVTKNLPLTAIGGGIYRTTFEYQARMHVLYIREPIQKICSCPGGQCPPFQGCPENVETTVGIGGTAVYTDNTCFFTIIKTTRGGGKAVDIYSCAEEAPPAEEICTNNEDDDNDGLIDCLDDDCLGQINTNGFVCCYDGTSDGDPTVCPNGLWCDDGSVRETYRCIECEDDLGCQQGERCVNWLCVPDSDSDGIPDAQDNCPTTYNPDQINTDGEVYGGDELGDACDDDDDRDTYYDNVDNCPLIANADQSDVDLDGLGDVCDNCREVSNPDQADTNTNCPPLGTLGYIHDQQCGDACEVAEEDSDGDGVSDALDNCPNTHNPNQADTDGDGIGDACDESTNCDDGIDNDADTLTDCADLDCAAKSCGDGCLCIASKAIEIACDDTLDNNANGLIDCDDPDCAGRIVCIVEICTDGIDNDEDGLIDCLDDDCATDPACAVTCPSSDWSNVCCKLTDIQFSDFITAQLYEETPYTDIQFSDFITAQLYEEALCE